MLAVKVNTFIPPFNHYDLNTLRALDELGFKAISSDRTGAAKERSLLKFLPGTCSLLQVRDAVERARQFSVARPVVIVLFHYFDFTENSAMKGKIKYRDLEKILSWVLAQKDVSVKTFNQMMFPDLARINLCFREWLIFFRRF